MPQPLTARVTPDGAASFEATITNLTPSSLFLRAPCDLRFRQSVTMEVGELTLYGEVAFVCHEPPGAVVVFRATAHDLHTLEDHMDEVQVVEGGEPWTPLSDEDPTNPAGRLPQLDGSDRITTSKFEPLVPPPAETDVDAKLATVVARPSDRTPTHGDAEEETNDIPTFSSLNEAGASGDGSAAGVLPASAKDRADD